MIRKEPSDTKGECVFICSAACLSPRTEEPEGLQPMGSQRVRHDGATERACTLVGLRSGRGDGTRGCCHRGVHAVLPQVLSARAPCSLKLCSCQPSSAFAERAGPQAGPRRGPLQATSSGSVTGYQAAPCASICGLARNSMDPGGERSSPQGGVRGAVRSAPGRPTQAPGAGAGAGNTVPSKVLFWSF